MRYTNKAAIKRYILHKVKKVRPGWRCTRVSHEAIEFFEMKASQLVRYYNVPPKYQRQHLKEDDLLVHSTVRKKLLEAHRELNPWFKVVDVSPAALDYIEVELEKAIISSLESHPSIGHTFKP
jgi:hypothetical protein